MSTAPLNDPPRRTKLLLGALVALSLLATFAIAAFLVTIARHKQESDQPYFKVVEITDTTVDPAEWGKNFPLQYAAYKQTVSNGATKYGGETMVKHTPTAEDPRTEVPTSKLDREPRLRDMWAGYAFAEDYREARGHEWMLTDQRLTARVAHYKQPGTCINCHASTYTVFNEQGDGDQIKGFDKVNHMTYAEATKLFDHPIACIDCHEPSTMKLRVTKPAFITGIKALKASQGIKDFDPNKDATPIEMRSFVCGQCHVEYYFEGQGKTLTFPWTEGLTIEDEYKTQTDHIDWTHATTDAKMLKAQHPDFETWSQGIHAKNGVSCADCHMPYKREGATKISDHWVRSPLATAETINTTCLTCHKASADEMKNRAETIQDEFMKSKDIAFTAVADLIDDLEKAKTDGTNAANIKNAQLFQRKASYYLDYAESENSTGFHAPAYSQRILGEATYAARQGQLALQGKVTEPKALDVTGDDSKLPLPASLTEK
ncbi:MAG TPA: ammonia-forming cytochrome c nitrite reductase subunit c552 [Candidatus Luteococcus avicola]|nr:ammonia-forming cytochrome c nitrite reductase subunit c552 [Candidatus Luteococcus avicola]